MHKQSKLQGHATYTSLQSYEWYTDGQQAVKRYLNTGKSTKITYRVTDEGNLSSFHNTAFFHTQLIESHVIVANRMPRGKKKLNKSDASSCALMQSYYRAWYALTNGGYHDFQISEFIPDF